MRQPGWISHAAPPDAFPAVGSALLEPNGLLAVGGDLSPERLLCAYRRGIFPWYADDQPILWWSPDPRAVLFPRELKVSRSLRKRLAGARYSVTIDTAFVDVVQACAAPRKNQPGTWITGEMRAAYARLHALGHAHSFECWHKQRLVGGLYGVAVGRVFFGESMFSRAPDASKVALAHLCRQGYALIDCQMPNDHLARLGAKAIARRDFIALLERFCGATPIPEAGSCEREMR